MRSIRQLGLGGLIFYHTFTTHRTLIVARDIKRRALVIYILPLPTTTLLHHGPSALRTHGRRALSAFFGIFVASQYKF